MHLGVLFSSDLKWADHIDSLVSRCCSLLGLLRRNARNLSFEQKCSVYLCIIRPKIEFASVLYDNCSLSYALKLEQLQRKAALVCSGANIRTENKLLLNFLCWDTLGTRRNVAKLNLFYSMVR